MEICLLDPEHLLDPGIIQVKAANWKIGNGRLYQSLPELGPRFLYHLQQIFVDDNVRRGNQYPLSSWMFGGALNASICARAVSRMSKYGGARGVLAGWGQEVDDKDVCGERCPVSRRDGLKEACKWAIKVRRDYWATIEFTLTAGH